MPPFVSYAQSGEDVVLWRALRDVENGYYIDVGAHDPERNSVTRAFYERGWSGINIEPVGAHFEQLQRVRTRDVNLRLVLTATTGEHEFFEIPDSGLSTLDSGVATRHRMSGKSVVAAQVRARLLRDVWSDFVKRDVHFLKIDSRAENSKCLLVPISSANGRGSSWWKPRPR